MTATEVLAAWAAELRPSDVPAEVSHSVARHLMDGVGNAVGARRLGLAAPAREVARALGGPPEAQILTDDVALSAPAAALAMGALVHALDFDDTHGGALVHATAVVLPAALAVGQQVGATGREVVTAATVGLETACRLGAAVPHGFHARGIHATAAVGPLAAAATAGVLLGLPAATLVDAFGIAGSSSGGLLEFLDTGADTKTLHPGSASLAGILAVRLAASGARGPVSVLEGRRGLWAALTDVTPDVTVVTERLGLHWEATRIGIKPYPSCQLMHVSLDALQAAVADGPVAPECVERVEVHVHPDSLPIVCGDRAGSVPRSTYDAKFDLPWSLAALIHDGAVTVDTYTDASIVRPEVSALAGRFVIVPRPAPVPASDAPGEVHLILRDGRTLTGTVDCSRGTAGAPLTDADLVAKLTDNCGRHPAAPDLADAVLCLAGSSSLDRLLDLAAHCSAHSTSPTREA